MKAISRCFLALASLLFVFATPQETQAPPVSETLDVTIVNVEVFVTDKRGRRIYGLTRDDFEVRENGRVQPITNFSEYAKRNAAPTTKAKMSVEAPVAQDAHPRAQEAPPAKRTIVLFVENLNLPAFRAKPMFAALRETLQRIVRPGDEAAIYSWHWGMKVRREFTDDVSALHATLAEIERESSRIAIDDTARSREMVREFDQTFYESLAAGAFGNGASVDAMAKGAQSSVFEPGLDQAHRELAKVRRQSKDLETLIQSMGAEEGKKILIMAMTRFGHHAGAQYFNSGTIPPRLQAELDTTPYRTALMRTANTFGVTLYPILPAGLDNTNRVTVTEGARTNIYAMPEAYDMASGRDNNVLLNETESLNQIAKETGGLMAWSTQDIIKLLPRIEDDLESYYSLGYRAVAGSKGGDIEVTTKDRRYTVRARKQFVIRDEKTRIEDELVANLIRPTPDASIPIEARFGRAVRDGEFWNVPLNLRFPVSALTVLPHDGRMVGEFSVHIVTGTTFGVTSGVQHLPQAFELQGDDQAAPPDAMYTYDVVLQVRPRAGRVSIAVVDEIGKQRGMILVDLPPLE